MRILAAFLFWSILFFGCNQNVTLSEKECKKLIGLDDSLYEIILNYQKLNPIPEIKVFDNKIPPPPETAFKYIYEVEFYSDKEDFVEISLNVDGIKTIVENSKKKLYGVYEDSCLKPTYIICDTKFSKKFLSGGIKKNFEYFIYDKSSIIDILYPTYIYKILNKKFYIVKKISGNIGQ